MLVTAGGGQLSGTAIGDGHFSGQSGGVAQANIYEVRDKEVFAFFFCFFTGDSVGARFGRCPNARAADQTVSTEGGRHQYEKRQSGENCRFVKFGVCRDAASVSGRRL